MPYILLAASILSTARLVDKLIFLLNIGVIFPNYYFYFQINGKRCGIARSEDNDTLFLGNICNTWTKEAVWLYLPYSNIPQKNRFYVTYL